MNVYGGLSGVVSGRRKGKNTKDEEDGNPRYTCMRREHDETHQTLCEEGRERTSNTNTVVGGTCSRYMYGMTTMKSPHAQTSKDKI
jgi:hypothetical protein